MISRVNRSAMTHSYGAQNSIERGMPSTNARMFISENALFLFQNEQNACSADRHASIRTYSALVEAGCTLGFSVSGWCCNLSVGLEGPGKNTQSPSAVCWRESLTCKSPVGLSAVIVCRAAFPQPPLPKASDPGGARCVGHPCAVHTLP